MLIHFIYLIVFTFLVWNGEKAYILAADAELEVDEHLNQTHSRHHKLHKNVMAHGVVGLVPKISIHGAIIVSARGTMAPPVTEQDKRKHDMLLARLRSISILESELPFPLTKWAPVFTTSCPLYTGGHLTERGLIWAHYRILREFSYFDPVLLHKIGYEEGKTPKLNNTVSSKDGIYAVYPNGTMYKNGIPFLEDDIITIFEDDAENAINDLNTTIIEEFSAMNTDLLFLGWCEGRTARPVPLCAHAFATTRRGARKIVKYLEPCGMAFDEQFVILAKNNLISWRRAYGHSYKDLNERYRGRYGEKTYGIIHQNKQLGSINGHRRRVRV